MFNSELRKFRDHGQQWVVIWCRIRLWCIYQQTRFSWGKNITSVFFVFSWRCFDERQLFTDVTQTQQWRVPVVHLSAVHWLMISQFDYNNLFLINVVECKPVKCSIEEIESRWSTSNMILWSKMVPICPTAQELRWRWTSVVSVECWVRDWWTGSNESSFPLHHYLAVSAASSGVSLLFTVGSSIMVWF